VKGRGRSVAAQPRLAGVVVAHAVIDFFSFIIIPILTVLEGRLEFSPQQGALLLAIGSICSGVIQPIVALLSDRYDTRWFGTLGFVFAVLAISVTGLAQEYWHLVLIQIVGTAGVGAFHPVAAAAMGHLSGKRRSLGVAIFFAAGMLGGIAGSAITPHYTKAFGVPALVWLLFPGMLTVALLAWATHDAPHRAHGASEAHAALTPLERRARWTAVAILYVSNALRFTVNMMLVQLVIRWSETTSLARAGTVVLDEHTRSVASTIGGPLQAAMQIGMGAAGLAAGAFLRARDERTALVVIPMLGMLAIAAFPLVESPAAAFVLTALAGAGFAGVLPLTISLAQRLLPHRTSLASGLMMGGAWSVAAIGPPLAQAIYQRSGQGPAFWCTAGLLGLAGLLGMLIAPSALRVDSSGVLHPHAGSGVPE